MRRYDRDKHFTRVSIYPDYREITQNTLLLLAGYGLCCVLPIAFTGELGIYDRQTILNGPNLPVFRLSYYGNGYKAEGDMAKFAVTALVKCDCPAEVLSFIIMQRMPPFWDWMCMDGEQFTATSNVKEDLDIYINPCG